MRFRPGQHVRRQRDFRNLRENGRRYDCGGFAFWYYKRAPESPAPVADAAADEARVGVVASYSAVGKAVSRVRAKRRLREIFRRNQQLVPPGYDVMLVARRSLNAAEFSAMEQRFISACQKIFPKQAIP